MPQSKTLQISLHAGELEALRNVIDYAQASGYTSLATGGTDRKSVREMRLARELTARIGAANRS